MSGTVKSATARRERGNALIIATLFLLVFLGMAVALVALGVGTERDVRSALSTSKAFYFAESGLNASLHEIGLGTDSAKDGLGNVSKTIGAGSYKAVVTPISGGGDYQVVSTGTYDGITSKVAATFDMAFDGINPSGAFGITGILDPLDKGYLKEKLKNNDLRIDGGPTPAIAVEDKDVYNELLSDIALAIKKKQIVPDIFTGSPLVPVVTTLGTVMLPFYNDVAPEIGSELLEQLRVELAAKIINDIVPAANLTITDAKGIAKNAVWGTAATPQVTVITKDVTPANGTTITGNGTLVVLGNMKLGDNTLINWTGNIFLVAGYKDPKKGAKLSIDGGSLNVTGNVGLLDAGQAKVYMDVKKVDGTKKPFSTINGSLLVLNNPIDAKEESVKVDHAQLTVNGLMAMSGERTKLMVAKDDSTLIVNGTLQMGILDGPKKTPEIKFNVTGNAYITFNKDLVVGALRDLGKMVKSIQVAVGDQVQGYTVHGWHPVP